MKRPRHWLVSLFTFNAIGMAYIIFIRPQITPSAPVVYPVTAIGLIIGLMGIVTALWETPTGERWKTLAFGVGLMAALALAVLIIFRVRNLI